MLLDLVNLLAVDHLEDFVQVTLISGVAACDGDLVQDQLLHLELSQSFSEESNTHEHASLQEGTDEEEKISCRRSSPERGSRRVSSASSLC